MSPAQMRAWIAGRLDPLTSYDPDKPPATSDFDLNPDARAAGGVLNPAAVLREAHEEIGLDPSFVTVAGLSTGYQTRTGYDITPVVGFVRPGFHLIPNPDEVADVFEVPFAFLMEPGNHERQFREQADGMRRYFYAMSYEDRVIWGATAGMVRVLYERLYGKVAASE
jgi:8-oxo-dGTP pyrophosphatase MutT (NUDIX family)